MVALFITLLGLGLFAFVWYTISKSRDLEIRSLEIRIEDLEKLQEGAKANLESLKLILGDKEAILEEFRAKEEGKKPKPDIELPDKDDEKPDPGAYMLGQGLITVEQHTQAQKKMASLQMDFLSVCLTLGYIDMKTASKVAGALKMKIKK